MADPPLSLLLRDAQDADADGLSDEVEAIIVTDVNLTDTDGAQGPDPLTGLAVQTGVIASAPTTGTATDVSALNSIAAVAMGAGRCSVQCLQPAAPPFHSASCHCAVRTE